MNPGQFLVLASYLLGTKILGGSTIKLDTIEDWIKNSANPNKYGTGYSGGRLSSGSSSAFVELRRDTSGGSVVVSASAFMDSRASAFAAKEWKGSKMDSKLEKMFGRNKRVRIDV
jgi:hypothetical protein